VSEKKVLLGTILSFLSLLLFLLIAFGVLNGALIYLDSVILTFVYTLRNPLLTQIMYFTSFLGGGFLLLLAVFTALVFYKKNHKREAVLFFFIVFSGFAINNIIKYLLKVARPDIDPLFSIDFYAFPSGHAMNSLIFYGLLSYFTFHFTKNRGLSVLTAILSTILILLVGFSRLYLGVHYPSDVLAGFAVGFWWLSTAILIDKTRVFYKLFEGRSSRLK